jgi:SAM-dependent methyltransferase
LEKVGIVMGAIFLTLALLRIIDKRHRSPVPSFVGWFLNSKVRYWVQTPDTVIRRSGVEQSMTVLDLGCGSGAFTTLLARKVGHQGRVYAVDVQVGMLNQLKRKLARAENLEISNIDMRLANAYEPPFEDNFLTWYLCWLRFKKCSTEAEPCRR